MTLSIVALSSRTATALIAPEGIRFWQTQPLAYSLTDETGANVCSGEAETAVLHLTGLEPDSRYVLHAAGVQADFRTRSCGGQIDIRDYGADPSLDDNAELIQQAIAAVPQDGTLRIPAGRYLSGPLFLKSSMTLHLDEGAELAAIDSWLAWPVLPAHDETGRVIGTWEGLPEPSFAALVNAVGCNDLILAGRGTLDGGGDQGDWWAWPKETRRGARRPRTVFLAHCRNITLTGLTVRNSPSWTIHPYCCHGVHAAALHICNPPDSPNTDGFNPESCEHVRLTGLHFSVGDDCIAIKAGKRDGTRTAHLAPSRDISVEHCLMERGHGAVVLGSEMSGGIFDVSVSNCDFVGTDRGLRIKTRRGRGGKVAGISMSNVVMDRVATAVSANAHYFCDADGTSDFVQSRLPMPVNDGTPAIGDIRVSNVIAGNVQLAAVALLGLPEAPITGVSIDNMIVSFDPDAQPGVPLMASDVAPCRHEMLLCERAEVTGLVTVTSEDIRHAS